MFGVRKKEDSKKEKTLSEATEKLEKMEIEQISGTKKRTNCENWQPWNLRPAPKISDEELGEWIQAKHKEVESLASGYLLQGLLALMKKEESK